MGVSTQHLGLLERPQPVTRYDLRHVILAVFGRCLRLHDSDILLASYQLSRFAARLLQDKMRFFMRIKYLADTGWGSRETSQLLAQKSSLSMISLAARAARATPGMTVLL